MRGTLFSASAVRMRSVAVARRHAAPRLASASAVGTSALRAALLPSASAAAQARSYATFSRAPMRKTTSKEPPSRTTPPREVPVQRLMAATEEEQDAGDKEEEKPKTKEQLRWEKLGLNPRLAAQLLESYPHLTHPTAAQQALLEALSTRSDVLLRAHTGTGKSLGLLLGLLAKPRVTVSLPAGSTRKQAHLTASLVLLPSNELVAQYMSWTRALFPKTALPSLAPIVQALVRGGDSAAQLETLQRSPPHVLLATPTRLVEILKNPADAALLGISSLRTLVLDEADAMIDLPPRFPSLKQKWRHSRHPPAGLQVLEYIMRKRATFSGGSTIASAGLEPGRERSGDERRPSEEVRRTAHRAREAGLTHAPPLPRERFTMPLQFVCVSATANAVLRHFLAARTGWLRTAVFDGSGRWIDCTGLSAGAAGAETPRLLRPSSSVNAKVAAANTAELKFGDKKAAAAAAAETTMEEDRPRTLPRTLQHVCIVVDAPAEDDGSLPELRNLDVPAAKIGVSLELLEEHLPASASEEGRVPKRREIREAQRQAAAAAAASAAEEENLDEEDEETALAVGADGVREGPTVLSNAYVDAKQVDGALLRSLALAFAAEGVTKGLALVPAEWSLHRTREALEELGMPVRLVGESSPSSSSTNEAGQEEEEGHLYLLQATAARGIDLPALSHVFILGVAAVGDAVRYTHLAGRVGRIGATPASGPDEGRAKGRVVTLVRGLDTSAPLPHGVKAWKEEKNGTKSRGVISSAEKKMGLLYRRLGVRPRFFDLQKGLEMLRGEEEEEAMMGENEGEEALADAEEEVEEHVEMLAEGDAQEVAQELGVEEEALEAEEALGEEEAFTQDDSSALESYANEEPSTTSASKPNTSTSHSDSADTRA